MMLSCLMSKLIVKGHWRSQSGEASLPSYVSLAAVLRSECGALEEVSARSQNNLTIIRPEKGFLKEV